MAVSHHGGGCCGVKHIYRFPVYSTEGEATTWLRGEMQKVLDRMDPRRQRGQLIEVALTDNQCVNWAKTLKNEGFRHVARWRNSNSGNVVNMFLYQPRIVRAKKPFEF